MSRSKGCGKLGVALAMKTRIDLRLRRVENQTTWFVCVLLSVVMTVE